MELRRKDELKGRKYEIILIGRFNLALQQVESHFVILISNFFL